MLLLECLFPLLFKPFQDTCICMAESFCCVPETITTLLIGYTPI